MLRILFGMIIGAMLVVNSAENDCTSRIKGILSLDTYSAAQRGQR